MSEPRTLTTLQETARRLADMALDRPEGITCSFDNANYPTSAACKRAAMNVRNNFNGMKAKEKRLMRAVYKGTPGYNDVTVTTKYDVLGCFIEETSSGWQLRIAKGDTILSTMRVTDTATGQTPKELTAEFGRWENLLDLLLKLPPGAEMPLSSEDTAFFWTYDTQAALRTWEHQSWELPDVGVELLNQLAEWKLNTQ